MKLPLVKSGQSLNFLHYLYFQVADSKREEFRKYLEKAGVLDAITKGTTRM
jgi:hypothetical protein